MTRITNAMKDHIVTKALEKSGNKAKRDSIDSRLCQWAEAARIDSLGGSDAAAKLETLKAKIEKLRLEVPNAVRCSWYGAVNTDSTANFNLAGRYVCVSFGDKREKRITKRGYHTMTADNPLVQQYWDLIGEQEDADAERDNISAQVRATVDKFGTIKRLLDAWPEAKELLPAEAPQAKSQLPAVPVADLNKLVGLPSETATA